MNETEHMVTDDNNVHVESPVDCTDSGAENLGTICWNLWKNTMQ